MDTVPSGLFLARRPDLIAAIVGDDPRVALAGIDPEMAQGLSNRQIARRFSLSERSVQGHVTRVLRAFGVANRWSIPAVLAVPTAVLPMSTGLFSVPTPAAARGPLTKRAAQVARLAAGGSTNQVIAHQLGISIKTVEKHLGQVFRAWNLSSRAQLAVALQTSWGQPAPVPRPDPPPRVRTGEAVSADG